ncbi:VanZ family protein [Confluentibacter sediminis]|uniref:VanZ family protein n=1 Tax=Confluentibacter sediminis TaxID=2219045 RepID=UPI000DACFD7A|nr:VanZ family protein [Confluentibacter sediminis]
MLKKCVFIITVFYSLALASVCLIDFKKLPDVGISFADKIFHSLTYTLLAFLWFNTLIFQFKMGNKQAIIYASVISIVFGIIIEVLQGVFTKTRHADVLDVLANSLGVLFMVSLIMLKNRITVKKL